MRIKGDKKRTRRGKDKKDKKSFICGNISKLLNTKNKT